MLYDDGQFFFSLFFNGQYHQGSSARLIDALLINIQTARGLSEPTNYTRKERVEADTLAVIITTVCDDTFVTDIITTYRKSMAA